MGSSTHAHSHSKGRLDSFSADRTGIGRKEPGGILRTLHLPHPALQLRPTPARPGQRERRPRQPSCPRRAATSRLQDMNIRFLSFAAFSLREVAQIEVQNTNISVAQSPILRLLQREMTLIPNSILSSTKTPKILISEKRERRGGGRCALREEVSAERGTLSSWGSGCGCGVLVGAAASFTAQLLVSSRRHVRALKPVLRSQPTRNHGGSRLPSGVAAGGRGE